MNAALEAVVGTTTELGIQGVLSCIKEIISKAKNYEENVERVSELLNMIHNFLSDAEVNNVSGDAVKGWLNQLKDVTFEADDVLDEVKYELLRRQVKKQNRGSKKTIFALASQTNTVRHVTTTERETESFSVEPDIVGREGYVSEMVEKLIAARLEEKITVIPIVGMGGIGKTTIARTIFHDEMISKNFDEKIWVSVPIGFDASSLFKKILETKEDVNVTSKEAVLQKIKTHLSSKRYLLILDDMWDKENWDEFIKPLQRIGNMKGNCILVTTRIESVASHVKTLPTQQLGCLSDIQFWYIIKAETSKGMDITQEFERIGVRIAERCDGLPLAARVVGGLLRGKSEEDWSNILENKLSDGGDDKITKILRLSYDNLPTLSLKKCFAYCAVFPQDYTIRRQEMIELWMAEGFLQVGDGDDMETVGRNIFNHLLQYSLFQDANRDVFGEVVDCKMHDLVHELARSITKDMAISQGQVKYLRTMFFKGKIAKDMFSTFKCLHVLKLTSSEIKELPSAIEKLIHLRSLDISSTLVEWLPDSIGKLYHLQTLSTGEDLEELPSTAVNLVSLRHLHASHVTKLPPGIGKLTSLRTLQHYEVRDEDGYRIEELGKFKNLRGELQIESLEMVMDKKEAELADLYGKPDLYKLVLKWSLVESSDGVGHHEIVLDGLKPHPRLKSLYIIGYKGVNLPSWAKRMAEYNNVEVRWEAFKSLVEIKLEGLRQCGELPMLGHLPFLKFLVLEQLPGVRSIGISFYGLENCSTPKTTFPALERLELLYMPELTEWLDVEGATTAFPCLKHLMIEGCPKLKNAHCHFPCLENIEVYVADLSLTNLLSNTSSLKYITIKSMPGLNSFPDELFAKIQNMTRLRIRDCPKLKLIVPNSVLSGASLKELVISDCENLEEVANDLSTLCNLEELAIRRCPRLKCIPYDARGQGLTSLRSLQISRCKGLKNLPIELLESCTYSLEHLYLSYSESLENLDTLIPCIWRMSHLKSLYLSRIPRLKNFPAIEICSVRSLESLSIGGFSESVNMASFNDGLTSILHNNCRSLRSLSLYGKEHWESLPDSIQYLTNLRYFWLTDFGIEDIPEWIGNLSSLQELEIGDCKRLCHLPSKETMKRLTKLDELRITECPLLKERCTPPNAHDAQYIGSEWPKISHIPDVWIDYEPINCLFEPALRRGEPDFVTLSTPDHFL